MELVTPDQMAKIDAATIEDVGIPGMVLMERASLGATDYLLDEHADFGSGGAVCLCGSGNNGGDGIAMARHLRAAGIRARIALLGSEDGLDGDARANLNIARSLQIPILEFGEVEESQIGAELETLCPVDVWIDALLGTGLDRDVEGRYRAAVEFMNKRSEPVFSVDIPSGVDGASGRVLGVGVEAKWTATFGCAKIGQALYPGRDRCGKLKVVDIGTPESVIDEVGSEATWLDTEWASDKLGPRAAEAHKGTAGRVFLIAGSVDKTGAALLSARAAMVSGAGLLTVGSSGAVVPRIAPAVPEVMATEVVAPKNAGQKVRNECETNLTSFVEWADVVGAGPGMGLDGSAAAVVETLLEDRNNDCLVLDADALTLIAERDLYDLLESAASRSDVVLTPHPGEMARLLDCDTSEVVQRPIRAARHLVDRTDCYVVLKMAATIVAGPSGRLAINRSGNPGLATAGAGDVLTGVLTARLAERPRSVWNAICAGVWAHGFAADKAAATRGFRGLMASDVIDQLPTVWNQMEPK